MMKICSTVAVVAALAATCAQAQEVILASQPAGAGSSPSLGQASTTNFTFAPQRAGDNITVLMSGDITNVTWWGQTVDFNTGAGNPDAKANILSFDIAIYEDAGGTVGAFIGSATVDAADVVTTIDGTQAFDGSDFFRYEAALDTPISVTGGARIISIAATLSNAASSEVFIWQYSAEGPDDGLYIDTGSGLTFTNLGAGINDLGVVLTSVTVEPPVTADQIEQNLRDMALAVLALNLDLFDAPNANAAKGRRKAMSNMLTAAANLTAEGDYAGAIDQLLGLREKMDDDPTPPDWLFAGPARDALRDEIDAMIAALLLL